MALMNPEIDLYLAEGCGRCSLGGTPECKVHRWPEVLATLRAIALDSGLTEERKWKMPCYTYQNHNVVMFGAFNDNCVLSFFKGALLQDPAGILEKPGENSHIARVIRFTNLEGVTSKEATLKAYIQQAIDVERAGLKPERTQITEPIPEELQAKLDDDPAFGAAWEALTPGRQRGYLLFFNAPKQSQTRTARVEKHIPDILAGKGINDRYSN